MYFDQLNHDTLVRVRATDKNIKYLEGSLILHPFSLIIALDSPIEAHDSLILGFLVQYQGMSSVL